MASEAAAVAEWRGYAAYCTQRELGLRKSALLSLDDFIKNMGAASLDERKRFVSWLMQRSYNGNALNFLLPHPLIKQLIDPTLEEWKAVDPQASEPCRWLGGYDNLKTALKLNPADDIARQKLVKMVVIGVAYEAHELPKGYIGNAREGYAELVEAAQEAFKLADPEDRRQALSKIATLKDQIKAHIARETLVQK